MTTGPPVLWTRGLRSSSPWKPVRSLAVCLANHSFPARVRACKGGPPTNPQCRALQGANETRLVKHFPGNWGLVPSQSMMADNKVKIVDEQTGRILEGRRYSDGLHQAIEAKERVKVEAATQTFATITLQNYFRMYHKLGGMMCSSTTEPVLWGPGAAAAEARSPYSLCSSTTEPALQGPGATAAEVCAPQPLSLCSRAQESQLPSPCATATEIHPPRAHALQREKPPQ